MASGSSRALLRTKLILGGALMTLAVPVLAQTDALDMLRTLTKGEWTVKFRDGNPDLKICVKSGEELIQIKHERTDCSRFVVENNPSKVTVQYTCPGDGYARTDIRRENASLVQIDSQGFVSGKPFQLSAEARRTGSC